MCIKLDSSPLPFFVCVFVNGCWWQNALMSFFGLLTTAHDQRWTTLNTIKTKMIYLVVLKVDPPLQKGVLRADWFEKEKSSK